MTAIPDYAPETCLTSVGHECQAFERADEVFSLRRVELDKQEEFSPVKV
jgi:hypothetical protein